MLRKYVRVIKRQAATPVDGVSQNHDGETMQRRNFMIKSTAALALGASRLRMHNHVESGRTADPVATRTHAVRSMRISTRPCKRSTSTARGSRELVGKARGVLVFPSVLAAGFIVGAAVRQGRAAVGGSVGYYSTTSGSIACKPARQSKAIIFLFMTQDSLDKFRNTTAGRWRRRIGGAGEDGRERQYRFDTATRRVEVFVLTNAGLMANLSLDEAV